MAKSAIDEVKKMDGYDILISDTDVTIRNKKVHLRPFKMKEGKIAQLIIAPYLATLLSPKLFVEDGTTYEREKTINELVIDVLNKEDGDVFGDISKLIAISTNDLTAEEIDEIGYDEGLILLAKIIDMNPRFFRDLFELLGLSEETPTEETKEDPKVGESSSTD